MVQCRFSRLPVPVYCTRNAGSAPGSSASAVRLPGAARRLPGVQVPLTVVQPCGSMYRRTYCSLAKAEETRLELGRGLHRYRHLLCGALAVVLAVGGQWAVGQSRLLEAGLLYALAVFLFVVAVRAQSGPVVSVSAGREGEPRRIFLFVGLPVVGMAALAGGAGVLAFASSDRSSLGWVLYGGSLGLLLLGIWLECGWGGAGVVPRRAGTIAVDRGPGSCGSLLGTGQSSLRHLVR